ncbi:hypothetical protein ADK34_01095 [Streptomyces viridochromogenes]|uniref:Uncharacterized protein n=1 Tax=Streptomyces viridochromogenes TaxID=1938 RepID=A0A0L8LEL3_STRVR|nr:hypothetical protein ADK34_01095 [Streptomyces viridochromogenes]
MKSSAMSAAVSSMVEAEMRIWPEKGRSMSAMRSSEPVRSAARTRSRARVLSGSRSGRLTSCGRFGS